MIVVRNDKTFCILCEANGDGHACSEKVMTYLYFRKGDENIRSHLPIYQCQQQSIL